MKTQDEMRSEFEKLPEIAMVLEENPDIRFEGDNYIYHGLDEATALATMFIFGAYYAFQEQQKKIDNVLNLVCKLQYSSGERIFGEVKELLK